MRPDDSVSGTKINGQNAAPIFQEVVAQDTLGNGSFCTWYLLDIRAEAAPYEPAGMPVRMELDSGQTTKRP